MVTLFTLAIATCLNIHGVEIVLLIYVTHLGLVDMKLNTIKLYTRKSTHNITYNGICDKWTIHCYKDGTLYGWCISQKYSVYPDLCRKCLANLCNSLYSGKYETEYY